MTRNHCPLCHGNRIEEIYHFGEVPFTTHYLPAPSSTFESYPLRINGCGECHFLFVSNPVDPGRLYSGNYNLTSSFPALHLDDLALNLMKALPSDDAFIVEIASNDGAFLERFLKSGYKNLLGIEPSVNCVESAREKGIEVINDFFSRESSSAIQEQYGKADLIVIRHAIEHIVDLESLLEGITGLCSEKGYVYVEFPDADFTFTYSKYMYFFEQHVNYFTTASCQRLFDRFGFQLEKEYGFSYGGGSKGILFKPFSGSSLKEPPPDFFSSASLKMLKINLERVIQKLLHFIEERSGATFGLYGPGFVGISLINNIGLARYLSSVFDDNPQKIGLFLSGSNLEIKSGKRLLEEMPDYCLISPLNEKNFETGIIRNNKEFLNNGGHFIEFFPKGKELDFFHLIDKNNQP